MFGRDLLKTKTLEKNIENNKYEIEKLEKEKKKKIEEINNKLNTITEVILQKEKIKYKIKKIENNIKNDSFKINGYEKYYNEFNNKKFFYDNTIIEEELDFKDEIINDKPILNKIDFNYEEIDDNIYDVDEEIDDNIDDVDEEIIL